jgi:hypothetical protein
MYVQLCDETKNLIGETLGKIENQSFSDKLKRRMLKSMGESSYKIPGIARS